MRTTKAIVCAMNTLMLVAGLAAISMAIPPGYERTAEEEASREAIRRGELPAAAAAQQAQSPILNQDGDKIFCAIDEYEIGTIGGSDVWGWEGPDGREYAIMGVNTGVAFVNVTDGQLVEIVPGPQNNCGNIKWRDIKTLDNYCYVTSECDGFRQGVMIIDMSGLPGSVEYVRSYTTSGIVTSHNLNIDTTREYAYVLRSNGDGFRPLDLSDREFPVVRNSVFTPDIHDLFARNDTVWVAEGNNGTWSVWNLANKNSAQLIKRIAVPNSGYVHNIWPNEDGTMLATTEETNFKTVKLWDVTDYNNVQLLGEYLGPSSLAHNAHFEGDLLYLSHYESGVIVLDISDPTDPVPISQFDTWLAGESPSFNGCWGVYPHTNSGKVYASNDNGRLFILDTMTVSVADTMFVDSVIVFEGETTVSVQVSLDNENAINNIALPFTWAGPYDLRFDSVSTVGLRTESFDLQQVTVFDAFNARAVVTLAAGAAAALGPGNGPVATLHFRINGQLSASPNPVSVTTVNGHVLAVSTECFFFGPEVENGFVTLWQPAPPCCVGSVGDANGIGGDNPSIGDIGAIVDFLFISGTPPSCLAEADANGSGGADPTPGDISVGDISVIVDHLFISGAPMAACP